MIKPGTRGFVNGDRWNNQACIVESVDRNILQVRWACNGLNGLVVHVIHADDFIPAKHDIEPGVKGNGERMR